jgi:hypothetical protein
MGNELNKDHHPGVTPLELEKRKKREGNPFADIDKGQKKTEEGLVEAIEFTQKKIKEYQENQFDVSELKTHLESLERRLEELKNSDI